jgi:hypothetical protein
MKVNMKTVKKMAKEPRKMSMENNMRVTGLMINSLEME